MKIGSDFSGVGAFEQALMRLGVGYETVFACDIDKYARQTYIENYGEPVYFPHDVYEREIPNEPLDIYMTSPPCQAFSIAGRKKGEDDHRGILFYNSHEFIKENRPRYFIFENVKGLLSDDNGKTFQRWIDFLGGKSVNGTGVMFPHKDSVPYHVYWAVLNAKDYGVPQNRERVFIIGIRDDEDNDFVFPKPMPLTKRLRDVLEDNGSHKYLSDKKVEKIRNTQYNQESDIIQDTDGISKAILARDYKDPKCVDEKYYLSDAMVDPFKRHKVRHEEKGTGFKWEPKTGDDIGNALRANGALCPTDNTIVTNFQGNDISNSVRVGGSGTFTDKHNWDTVIIHNVYGGFKEKEPRVFKEYSPTIRTAKGGGHIPSVKQQDYKIRRLTPRECFRLMDFPDTFDWTVSDTQAYKQAGNSIVVSVLYEIIKKLKL